MQLTYPFFFLLSLLIAAVILFYFFRKQYEETMVSSNLFWKEVLNEWQASPFLKKLQQNLLFWLQILALLLLMFALVRPVWYEAGLRGEQIVFILDPSATMSASVGNSNRFEQAKQELSSLARKMNGQEVTIIIAGQNPEIILKHERDKTVVLQAIEKLEPTYEHENMEKALRLAASVSAKDNSSMYIFSDCLTKETVEQSVDNQYVEVHNLGTNQENLSLISFGVGDVNGKIAGIAVIENQSNKTKKVTFQVKGGSKVFFSQEVTINAQDSFVVTIPELPEQPFYKATIDVDDGYVVDNQVTSIYHNPAPSVFVVGDMNSFVIKGFETLGVEIIQTDLDTAKEEKGGIIVTEGESFSDLPDQPLILFNNEKEKLPLTDAVNGEDDSLLKYVEPEKIFISSAMMKVKSDLELNPILKSGQTSLIEKGTRDGQPVIVFNFSLSDSDWPLQPDFPIFLYNSYQWLSQQTGFLGYFNPGEKKWLNTDTENSNLEIFNDQDENIATIKTQKEYFSAPYLPGTYQAVSGERISHFSVLLDNREKQTVTAPSFKLNTQQGKEEGTDKRPNEFLWFVFAALAFVLMTAEWEVYRRGLRG